MGVHEDILNLEMKINQLRIDYDQYFAGILKIPPFKLQEEIKRMIRLYSSRKIQNTALNFRYKSQVSRYTTYDNLWQRHMRMINDGSMQRGAGFKSSGKKKDAETSSETPAEKLYKEYIQAKSSLKQSTSDVKVQSLQSMIDKQTAAIKAKYKCSSVDYKVVTEGGKAKIKAIPKK
ncbi:MAG: hypothetical protein OEV42_01160 [Deltaproteobacteria bacterium]|nr:hypothetical protein [Deltaproteobacteria bacterium]